MFWNEIEVMVAQHSNVVNATELFPSKCLILSYVNFTKKKKMQAPACLSIQQIPVWRHSLWGEM